MVVINGAAPTVSIGVPVYNGASLLARALDSLLAQHFSDFEIIVSDNGSTDGTAEIADRFAARDPRVRVIRQPTNIGAARNFNAVFAESRGRYFKWMAHDDVIAPDYLDVCVGLLEQDASAVLSYTGTSLINDDGSVLPFDAARGAFVDRYGKAWFWSPPQVAETASEDPVRRYTSLILRNAWCLEVFGLIRSDALRKSSLIGLYYGSDKVLLLELATMGRFVQDPVPLFQRGCQPNQSSYLKPQQQATWIRGDRPKAGIAFDQGLIVLGMLKAGWCHDFTMAQRLAATSAVLRHAAQPHKLRRLFIPGPDNYFGFGARRYETAGE